MRPLFQELLSEVFRGYKPKLLIDDEFRRAAVIIPIYESEKDQRLSIIFTKRSNNVQQHKGEISLPGGAQEGNEHLQDTALRETEEELGSALYKIIGQVDDFQTITQYLVTPFVGYTKRLPSWVPNKEVERIIMVPLIELINPSRWDQKSFNFNQQERIIYFFKWSESEGPYALKNDIIWGATAAIIKNFLSIISNSSKLIKHMEMIRSSS